MLGSRESPDVVLFVPLLSNGGAERVMVLLANQFADRGLLVHLAVGNADGPDSPELHDQVRLVVLGHRRSLLCVWPLSRHLKRARPRVVLSAMPHANVAAVLAQRLAGGRSRVAVSVHSHFSAGKLVGLGRLLPPLIRWAYAAADVVVGVSDGVCTDVIEQSGVEAGKVRRIYNPVVTQRLLEMRDQALPPYWKDARSWPTILAVGRLEAAKDFDCLIRAFAVVRQKRAARLMILGEGSTRPSLERLVVDLGLEDDVLLPGFDPNPYPLMQAADVFVLSSRWEGLGNVLIEALACGTPVISTDCPSGPAEILENGRWGRLVPVGDHVALAAAILNTLDESHQLGRVARANDFRADVATDLYLSALALGD